MSEFENVRIEAARSAGFPDKVLVFGDTGKKYENGKPTLARIELFRSKIYSGRTESEPYGKATDTSCYRVVLGKFPKVGLTEQGVKDLIKGLQMLLKEYPL